MMKKLIDPLQQSRRVIRQYIRTFYGFLSCTPTIKDLMICSPGSWIFTEKISIVIFSR